MGAFLHRIYRKVGEAPGGRPVFFPSSGHALPNPRNAASLSNLYASAVLGFIVPEASRDLLR